MAYVQVEADDVRVNSVLSLLSPKFSLRSGWKKAPKVFNSNVGRHHAF